MINLNINCIPPKVRKIHMIAACGTGMGALACMLQDMGFEVTGSDQNVYPPMSDFLIEKGIRLFKGFSPLNLTHPPAADFEGAQSVNFEGVQSLNFEGVQDVNKVAQGVNIQNYKPDLVIIGNAVTSSNVEAVAVMEQNIPYCSMPEALNHFAAKGKKILLITGTHGKTTTSSILAHVLNEAGLDPSFMIGGIVKNFNSNYRIGNGDYIVIEGDEYDTAFFDKGPKFMHYSPFASVITSVEFDHADIFKDIAHVKKVFSQLIAKTPSQSLIMASSVDINIKDIIGSAVCHVQYYGECVDFSYSNGASYSNESSYSNDWSYSNLTIENGHSTFLIKKPSGDTVKIDTVKIKTPLMGRHNAMNILAVFGVAKWLGISDEIIVKALQSFLGVKRRQDIRGVKNGITVMDDFAHHPSAVRETIAGVKPFFTKGRLIAVFEPRTNSSMRDIFQNEYPKAFYGADIVCVREPSMLSKIPQEQRINTEKLVQDIIQQGIRALYFTDTDKIIEFLTKESKVGDLLLIMSNGGFDNIHQRLLETL